MREEGGVSDVERTVRKPMIKPERGRGAIIGVDTSNGSKGIELIIDDPSEVAIRPRSGGVEGSSVLKKPVFPVGQLVREKLVDEFH
jgi:hypothetical protein